MLLGKCSVSTMKYHAPNQSFQSNRLDSKSQGSERSVMGSNDTVRIVWVPSAFTAQDNLVLSDKKKAANSTHQFRSQLF